MLPFYYLPRVTDRMGDREHGITCLFQDKLQIIRFDKLIFHDKYAGFHIAISFSIEGITEVRDVFSRSIANIRVIRVPLSVSKVMAPFISRLSPFISSMPREFNSAPFMERSIPIPLSVP